MDSLSAFTAALSAPDQPSATMAALEQLAARLVGFKVLTLMAVDHENRLARRVQTSAPAAYPLSGAKQLEFNDWSAAVLDRHETWVMNSIDRIAEVFPDHALIASLGCQSSMNLPIVVGGRVLGTINFLHEAGYFTADRVAAARSLQLPGAVAFLMVATDLTKDKA